MSKPLAILSTTAFCLELRHVIILERFKWILRYSVRRLSNDFIDNYPSTAGEALEGWKDQVKKRKILWVLLCSLILGFYQNCGNSQFATVPSQNETSPQQLANLGSVDLSWDQNTDSVTVGYKIYYGTQSGNYTNAIDVGSAGGSYPQTTVSDLAIPGTYYFVVKAYDTAGNESVAADEVLAQF